MSTNFHWQLCAPQNPSTGNLHPLDSFKPLIHERTWTAQSAALGCVLLPALQKTEIAERQPTIPGELEEERNEAGKD